MLMKIQFNFAIVFGAMILLLLAMPGCAVLDPSPDATIKNLTPPPPAEESGEQLYRNHCTGCHNTDGAPRDPTVDDLRNYRASYGSFDTTLNLGPGAMPIYTYQELDSAERRKIFDHIKTFK